MKTLLFIFSFTLSLRAGASDRPDWTRTKPAQHNGFKFYVGRASNAETESKGYEEASRNAIESAIRENYGFLTRLESQNYEAGKDWEYSRRVQELSRNVRLVDFEQVENHMEMAEKDKVNVWILYRYSLEAIKREKARLESGVPTPTEFNEVGVDQSGGRLIVKSEPPGAEVRIDGMRWGITPLRIRGGLQIGKHEIEIDHPKYKVVHEKFIFAHGVTSEISKKLIAAEAWLTIRSKGEDGKIFINGRYVGTTDVKVVKVQAGTSLQVEFVNPDFEKLTQTVEAARDEEKVIDFTPIPKPAFIQFVSMPGGAEVEIDGARIGNAAKNRWITAFAGRHTVTVVENSETLYSQEFRLHAGERKVIAEVKSRSREVASENRETVSDYFSRHQVWGGKKIDQYVGLSWDYFSASLANRNDKGYNALALSFGGDLGWPLGWEIGFSYDATTMATGHKSSPNSQGDSSGSAKKNSVDFEGGAVYVGVPLYFRVGAATWMALGPETGFSHHKFYYSSDDKIAEYANQYRYSGFWSLTGQMGEGSFWQLKLMKNKFTDSLGESGMESTTLRFGILFGESSE